MRTLLAMFVLLGQTLVASNVSAEGVACEKQRLAWGPITSDSRLCRINMLFESWLIPHGILTDSFISTSESVQGFGSNWIDGWVDGYPHQIRPEIYISYDYYVDHEESSRIIDLFEFQKGYFQPLETLLRREARKIICETPDPAEDEFLRAGGVITYKVSLRLNAYKSRRPDVLARVVIPQSACELP